MNTPRTLILVSTMLAVAGAFTFSGCASDYDGGGGDVDFHGSFYYGVGYGPGFYGPPMYGPGYYPPPVVVTPPPVRPPGGGGGTRPMPPMPRPTPRAR